MFVPVDGGNSCLHVRWIVRHMREFADDRWSSAFEIVGGGAGPLGIADTVGEIKIQVLERES